MKLVIAECLCFGCSWRVSMCSFDSAFRVAVDHFRHQHRVDLGLLVHNACGVTQYIAFMGNRAMVRFDLEGEAQVPYVLWELSAADRQFLKTMRIAADGPTQPSFFR